MFHPKLISDFNTNMYLSKLVSSRQNVWVLVTYKVSMIQSTKMLLLPPKYKIIIMPSNHSNFQYCDSNIGLFSIAPCKVITLNSLCDSCRSFSLLKAIAIILPLLFANAFKSDNYMGSNTENKPWTNLQNSYKNLSKDIKSDNFCYRKVGRAITKCGAIEKNQYWYRNIGIITIFKRVQKLFCILLIAIIFSSTVYNVHIYLLLTHHLLSQII